MTILLKLLLLSTALVNVQSTISTSINSQNDFQKLVMDVDEVRVVFFKNSKTYNQNDDGLVIDLNKKLNKYNIESYVVDCGASSHKKTCQGIRSPTIQLYVESPTLNPYTKSNYRPALPYMSGDGSITSIERFITKNYPNKVIKLSDWNIIQKDESKTQKVIIASEKDTIPLLLKSLAYQYKNTLSFYYIHSKTGKEILDKLNIATTPTMLYLPSFDDISSVNMYSGSFSDKENIVSWISTFIISMPKDNNNPSQDPSQSSDSASGSGSNSNSSQKKFRSMSLAYQEHTSTTLQLSSLSLSYSYIISVMSKEMIMNNSIEYQQWENKIAVQCEGNIKAILLSCVPVINQNSTFTNTTEENNVDKTLGELLCHRKVKESVMLPYLYMVPYSSGKRIKKRTTSNTINTKYVYNWNEEELARKQALDSLPKSTIKYLMHEQMLDQMVQENGMMKRLSVTFISNKPQVSSLLYNVATTLTSPTKLAIHEQYGKYYHPTTNTTESTTNFDEYEDHEFSNIYEIGYLSEPSPAFIQKISGGQPSDMRIPTIVCLYFKYDDIDPNNPGPPGAQVALYRHDMFGPLKYDSIVAFVNMVYTDSGFKPTAKTTNPFTDSSSSHTQPSMTSTPTIHMITKHQDWTTHCPETFRGICSLTFIRHPISDIDQLIITQAATSLNNNQGVIRFLTIDAICQQDFSQKFGVDINLLPTVVAYSANKKKYALFRGVFQPAEIKSFFDSVLAGTTPTFSLSDTLTISDTCAVDMSSSAVEEEMIDEPDANDFLEEIRREEAEKAKLLKKQTEEALLQLQEEQEKEQKLKAEIDKKTIRKIKKVIKKKKKKTNSNEL